MTHSSKRITVNAPLPRTVDSSSPICFSPFLKFPHSRNSHPTSVYSLALMTFPSRATCTSPCPISALRVSIPVTLHPAAASASRHVFTACSVGVSCACVCTTLFTSVANCIRPRSYSALSTSPLRPRSIVSLSHRFPPNSRRERLFVSSGPSSSRFPVPRFLPRAALDYQSWSPLSGSASRLLPGSLHHSG